MPPLLECLPYIGVTSVTRGTVCTLHRVNIYAGSVDWGTYNGCAHWSCDYFQDPDPEIAGDHFQTD